MVTMWHRYEFKADMYISVGSIVSRQTSGQVYEAAHGLRRASGGFRCVVDASSDDCKFVMYGITSRSPSSHCR